jgi:hypothetical protein
MRVYVHYRQQKNCEIRFADLEGTGRHDFNVRRGNVEFEVEAKTLSEDIGNLVSTEESLLFFSAYKEAIARVPSFRESGFLTYSIKSRREKAFSLEELTAALSDFMARAIPEKQYGDATLHFERKPAWESMIQQHRVSPIRAEILERQKVDNSHAMITLGNGQVVMFCIAGSRPLRLFRGIRERLKHASSQLSGTRPGMIWVHFWASSRANLNR